MAPSVCLICYDGLPHSPDNAVNNNEENGTDRGRTFVNLNLFTVERLLEVPKERWSKWDESNVECEKILGVDHPHPNLWVGLCVECKNSVEEAMVVYEELLETVKRFRKKQNEIVGKLWATEDITRKGSLGRRRRSKDDELSLKITEDVRKLVRDLGLDRFHRPLLIEEITNETSHQSASPVVKEEIVTDYAARSDSELDDFADLEHHQSSGFEDPLKELTADLEVKEEVDSKIDCDNSDSFSNADTDSGSFANEQSKEVVTPKNGSVTVPVDYECTFCSKVLRTEKLRGRHMVDCHIVLMRKIYKFRNKYYYCPKIGCKRKDRSWRAMHDHVCIHDRKPIYRCNTCSTSFYTVYSLQNHERKTHPGKAKQKSVKKMSSEEGTTNATFPNGQKDNDDAGCSDEESMEFNNNSNVDDLSKENDEDSKGEALSNSLLSSPSDGHKCMFCDLTFPNEALKGHHMGHVHRTQLRKMYCYRNNMYHCPVKGCKAKTKGWRAMHDHVCIHEKKPAYKCKTCSAMYYTERALNRHNIRAHSGRKLDCDICGAKWKAKKAFDRHMTKHEEEEKQKAAMKDNVSGTNDDPMTDETNEALRCYLCRKLFKSQTGVKHHILAVHGIRLGRMKYPCPKEGCGKIFTHKETMEAHFARIHENTVLFNCEQCGKGFFRKYLLARHQQLNHSSEKFVCEKCGESFDCIDNLYMHRSKVHNTVKRKRNLPLKPKPVRAPKEELQQPVLCPQCGITLESSFSLKQHIKFAHEQQFSVNCDQCGQGFSNPYHLKMHLYNTHKIGEKPEEMITREKELHQCLVPGCKRRFYGDSGKISLQKHIIRLHGESGVEMRFQCGVCGRQFCEKYKFQQHEMTHTNKESRPFKCELCGKGFANNSNRRYHQLFTHKVEKKRGKKLASTLDEEEPEVRKEDGGYSITSL